MSVLADLPSGRRGVRFTVPPELESIATDERPDILYAPDRSIAWQFFLNQLPVDARPRHNERLLLDAHRCARDVFITYSSTLEQIRPLRTDDPTWSPLVEITPTQLRGAPVLTAIHRMSYQPGHEFVMGHLLVPIRAGLFELRLLARADMTGLRESMLVGPILHDARTAGEDPLAAAKRLGQAYFDDPAHDPDFPDHPLSRIRRALAWVLERSDLEVTDPPEPFEDGELAFPYLGHAFVPPPRYWRVDIGNPYPQFARFSFTPTDGVHELSVHRHRHPIPGTISRCTCASEISPSAFSPLSSETSTPTSSRAYRTRTSTPVSSPTRSRVRATCTAAAHTSCRRALGRCGAATRKRCRRSAALRACAGRHLGTQQRTTVRRAWCGSRKM